MRFFTILLIVLLGIIQLPLWLEYGGLLSVRELQKKLNNKIQNNSRMRINNEHLMKEIQGLESGTAEIEESARYKMKMLKAGEIFIQIEPQNTKNFSYILDRLKYKTIKMVVNRLDCN
ncbi:MAG: septum formation initiator family protein [Burkholderia sp.]|nr:septum formation initiator family protein [Burkholderia sp.]